MKTALLVIGLLVVLSAVFAGDEKTSYWTFDETVAGVQTSVGVRTISEGAKIGGDFTNSITITEEKTVITKEAGAVTFSEDTEIDCEHPPGTPDPCNFT
jgi:hypothetical protein